MLLLCLVRDLSLVSDEPVPVLPGLIGLGGDLSLCLGGKRRGEGGHLDLLEWLSECLLEFRRLAD